MTTLRRPVGFLIAELSHDKIVQRAATSVAGGDDDRAPGLWAAFEALVSEMSPGARAVLGEKTPGHVIAAPLLAQVHPELKIVAVVRDLRAVLASHREVGWGIKETGALAWLWRLRMSSIEVLVLALAPERVHVATFESVLADPTVARERIARYLGVPDEFVPVAQTSATLFAPREVWRQRAPHDADRTRVERWRDVLVPLDERLVLAIAGPVMERFGYDTTAAVWPATHEEARSLDDACVTDQIRGVVGLRERRAGARPYSFTHRSFR